MRHLLVCHVFRVIVGGEIVLRCFIFWEAIGSGILADNEIV